MSVKVADITFYADTLVQADECSVSNLAQKSGHC